MRTKKDRNFDYFDALIGKLTSSWLFVNWKMLYVPQYPSQPRLAVSLLSDALSITCDEPRLWKIFIIYKNAIFFVDPITRQTYPDAQVPSCSDRIRNHFQFDMEDENSWFTITPTLERRKRLAVFGPKDVTLVSRKAFGGAGDAGIYTRAQLSEFWDKILISAGSRKTLQKFSREIIVPNTENHGPEQ